MRLLGKAHEELGMIYQGLKWYRLACAEAPDTREPWCELATATYRLSMWPESYGAALSALNIKDKQAVYTMAPEVWGFKPHDYAAIAAWHLGLKKQALFHGQNALDLDPENLRLIENLKHYKNETLESIDK